ncbi:hypothetical protein BJV74DRAFT_161506 [Russula compacta]|nr:hypothetical protein BJV74DRAFT_161506 [Russula compacta]
MFTLLFCHAWPTLRLGALKTLDEYFTRIYHAGARAQVARRDSFEATRLEPKTLQSPDNQPLQDTRLPPSRAASL